MTTLCRATHRWKARRVAEQLAGMVAYELVAYDGTEVRVPFEPKVEYDERYEPEPWVVR